MGLPGLVPRIHRGLHVVHHHDTVYMVYTLTVMSMLLVMPHPDLSDRKSMICSSIPGLHLPHLVSLLPSQWPPGHRQDKGPDQHLPIF